MNREKNGPDGPPAGRRERFRGYLGAQKLKMTRERRLVLDAVTEMRSHFGADDLYVSLAARKAPVSRATVYRTLEHLVASGIVQKLYLSDHTQRKALYEYVHGREHHEHMHCLSCGRVIEFTDEALEKRQDRVCRERDFTPLRHSLRIEGVCGDCREAH
jgi:Fur family ferric uptake transcriptional regulator